MRRCIYCPVHGIPCPSVTHSRYCWLAQHRPHQYRAVIVRNARALAGIIEQVAPARAMTETVQAALVVSGDHGPWLSGLVRQSNPDRLSWTGVAFRGGGCSRLELARELAGVVPMHAGPFPQGAPDGLDRLVESHVDERTAVREACHGAEVLVAWGIPNLDQWEAAPGIPVVLVSTGDRPARRLGAGACAAAYCVAVTRAAARAFALSRQPDVTVLSPGVEVERCAPRVGRSRQRAEWGLDAHQRVVGLVGKSWGECRLRTVAAVSKGPKDRYRVVALEGHGFPGEIVPTSIPTAEAGNGTMGTTCPHRGDVLAAVDVVLGTTEEEGWPAALVEAWLAGVPTVVIPGGAGGEWLRESGPLGLLLGPDPGPAELAAGLRRALSPAFQTPVEEARRRAWQSWTAGAMAERWTNYLAALVRPWSR